MSVSIKSKHSSVANKAPLPTDLVEGELALNINAASPAAYIKDSAGAIVKLAGAGAIGGTPATETAAGIVELATAAETTTGTDATRAVHPAGLKVELDKKANLASPALTGAPTAPTAIAGTNTTQLATTAFVGAAITAAATPDATTTVKGVVQLADAAAITAGTVGRVVDAAQLKAVSDADDWTRTGTELSPKIAGDSVFTTGAVKVGGTTAASNITLKADGKIEAKTAEIKSSGAESTLLLRNTSATPSSYSEILFAPFSGTTAATCAIRNYYSGFNEAGLNFYTTNATGSQVKVAHFHGSGDVLIGGTLPASPNITLKADGNINAKGAVARVYADNAAAKAGGLVAGDIYRTATGQLMIVFT